MTKQIDPGCTYYESAFKTGEGREVSLSEYVSYVREGKYKAEVVEFRRLRAINKLEEADARKRRLPILVPSGKFSGGRKASDLVSYSGCLVADLDDVPGDPADWLLRARELAYVKAGHVSPSGKGVKLFVLTDTPAERHLDAFLLMKRRLELDRPGITVDPSGKDVCRGCFVSYDPGAFYKGHSELLLLPPPAVELAGGVPAAGSDDSVRISHYLDRMEERDPFVKGGRHDLVFRASAACNRAGFPLSVTLGVMLARYERPDFTAKEIEATVRSGYQISSTQSGVNKQVRETRRTRETRVGFILDNEAPDGDESYPDERDLPIFPDWLYEGLPTLFSCLVSRQPAGRRRDMLLLSGLAVVSACLPGVSARVRGQALYPHLFVFVEGASGSGKGIISPTRILADRYAYFLEAESARAEEKYKHDLEEHELLKHDRLRQKASARQPLPPCPKPAYTTHLLVPPSVSKGKLLHHLKVNGPLGCLMFAEEADSLMEAHQQRYGQLLSLLRCVAMHEEVGESFKKDDCYVRVPSPRMALVLSGTLHQFSSLLSTAEDGMMGRMLFYHNYSHPEWIPVTEEGETSSETELFGLLSDEVYGIAMHLRQNPIEFHLTLVQRNELNATFSKLMFQARALSREEMEGIIRRSTMMLYRLAMILTAVRHAQAGYVSGSTYCSDDDFSAACRIVLDTLEHAEYLLDFLPPANLDVKRAIRPQHRKLLAALPENFTRKEAQAIGRTMEIGGVRVNEALRSCEGVYLSKLEGDSYRKLPNAPK